VILDSQSVKTTELEVVAKPPGATTFIRLPHRWMVERTFAWWRKCRRLSTEDDHRVRSSTALTQLAVLRLRIKRLAHARCLLIQSRRTIR